MRSTLLLCCLVEAPADRRRLAAYNYIQVDKLTAADGAAGSLFGSSVAIDGDSIVIGAYSAGTGGAAYVLRTTDGGATYAQVAKLTASDAAASDYFGFSVAIDGDTIVIGAYQDDDGGTGSGSAYVFHTTDGGATYGQVAKLTASDAAQGDLFGRSVAIDGDTIVVGASSDDTDAGSLASSAYVYRTSSGWDTAYTEVKLTAVLGEAGAFAQFGWSVAIDGDTVVVGANGGSGAVYVYHTSNGGVTYGYVAKLAASYTYSDAKFGFSVAIDGDTIVVGAYRTGSWSGPVYVFRTSDGGTTYPQVATLTTADAASDNRDDNRFGYSVAIAGDTVVVGAYEYYGWGSAYVFRTSDGATYGQVAKLTASDGADEDGFGHSVAIDGERVVVGASGDDDGGSAYVFDANAPTSQPTASPTSLPISQPTSYPTFLPSLRPSPSPTTQPTARPSAQPTTAQPTTAQPTLSPIPSPTVQPTAQPVQRPQPAEQPTPRPTPAPTPSTSDAVEGSFTCAGITLADAEAHAPVYAAAVADIYNVDESKVIVTFAAFRRRLQSSGDVVVSYQVLYASAAAATAAATAASSHTASTFQSAVQSAASNKGVNSVFAATTVQTVATPATTTTTPPPAQPTKQLDDDDDAVLAVWEIALIFIAAGFIFGIGCFVCTFVCHWHTMGKSQLSAKTSPAAPEIEMPSTVEAVQTPDDAPSTPPILGEVVTHSTVLSVPN